MNDTDFKKLNKIRAYSLAAAEQFDAWRIIPRAIAVGYTVMITYIISKFVKFEYIEKTDCSASVMQVLLDKGLPIEQVTAIACQITDVIGPPDSLTAILAIVIGAGAAVFGFYANTGRKWNGFTSWNNPSIIKKPPSPAKEEDDEEYNEEG